ncbi:C45 family autoproteolytic acyltransferase/hydolase [Clostridium merdae]|uniref:C45 family autoproteolytic acyltransferase/hydolase n=1 Tax=Clostridium merdae TaxID=1958780 RepID=UPI000A26C67E|nr:C45 family peptidase [Clostridium merdae]
MYHVRCSGTHYEAGYRWGCLVRKNGKKLDSCPTFALTEETYAFAKECVTEYETHFPEVLDEIKGIAEGNGVPVETLQALLFSMYCFSFDNKCTCFAFRTPDEIVFARNSDFLVSLEKLYMNCLYRLEGAFAFNGNTTAFVQMEDGVNEHGLAVGLTFVYPHVRKPGLNSGMLVRCLLEKCRTTAQAINLLHSLPIASAQTLTIADKSGEIAVVECNPVAIEVIRPREGEGFVATANNFNSAPMYPFRNPDIDDWRSDERYQTARNALEQNRESYTVPFAQDILAGKYGFMCQYDRKKNADTVWSVVYDLKRKQIWRVEGNPARKPFEEDKRMKLEY